MQTLNLKGKLITLDKPLIMGILNLTPDSFFDGGRYSNETKILQKAEQMLSQGVFLLDVGGYSTRPNASEISLDEELKRTISVVELLQKNFPESYISIDTFRSEVARQAVQAGACIINDVSGGNLDEKMFETVAFLQVPYVLVHLRGTPQTMQTMTNYTNILTEITQYFALKTKQLIQLGVKDIILDVGFGFAKTTEQNFFLLKNLSYFQILGFPILTGLSRKGMIYKTLQTTPENALNGTSALNMVALLNGTNFLRVHDVQEAKEICILYEKLHL
jgi:dihydropteroate synthase